MIRNRRKFAQAMTLAALAASVGHATTISLKPRGDAGGGSGLIDIVIGTGGDFGFLNGGISLSVATSRPDMLRFTDAEVVNVGLADGAVTRWTAAEVQGLSADRIDDLFAFSIMSPGLDSALPGNSLSPGIDEFVFATIGYELLDADGGVYVQVGPSMRADPLVSEGVDVSDQISYQGICLGGECLPADLAANGLPVDWKQFEAPPEIVRTVSPPIEPPVMVDPPSEAPAQQVDPAVDETPDIVEVNTTPPDVRPRPDQSVTRIVPHEGSGIPIGQTTDYRFFVIDRDFFWEPILIDGRVLGTGIDDQDLRLASAFTSVGLHRSSIAGITTNDAAAYAEIAVPEPTSMAMLTMIATIGCVVRRRS